MHPVYERRKLYLTICEFCWRSRRGTFCSGLRLRHGRLGLPLAGEGARVASLDLSEAAIQVVCAGPRPAGCAATSADLARDASDLGCFRDAEFDLIYASSRTSYLKYPNALRELMRVLRPGASWSRPNIRKQQAAERGRRWR